MPTTEKRTVMDHELAEKCREIVFKRARKYGIPPAYIVAHVRMIPADKARVEAWREMITRLGMSRQLVATIFGRDRRRLRRSVIGV